MYRQIKLHLIIYNLRQYLLQLKITVIDRMVPYYRDTYRHISDADYQFSKRGCKPPAYVS
jgi:hypothetical protein